MKKKPIVQPDCQTFLLPNCFGNGLLLENHSATVVNDVVNLKQLEVRHD
ncbi:virulence promoting factor [Citrobacter sp. JGM124]|nr:virulence promoting factor [Citrobacter sp. JGM124]